LHKVAAVERVEVVVVLAAAQVPELALGEQAAPAERLVPVAQPLAELVQAELQAQEAPVLAQAAAQVAAVAEPAREIWTMKSV